MHDARERAEHARGLMLGLLLGDAHDEWEGDGPLHGTCLSQLACFTLEGLIRAHERGVHKGICHPPAVIWHAWCRWAHVQGLGDAFAQRWSGGSSAGWPDGWLHQVRPLSVRRGSAPATVAALRRSADFPKRSGGSSSGHHAVTRALPLAILTPEMHDAPGTGADLAALTHGSQQARDATASGVALAARALAGDQSALWTATALPGSDQAKTAPHALWHGLAAARGACDFAGAVQSARPHGRGAATVAGALFGALRGAQSLDSSLLRRHELAWVGEQLARDAVREVVELPGGTEYSAGDDPTWAGRYPGW